MFIAFSYGELVWGHYRAMYICTTAWGHDNYKVSLITRNVGKTCMLN